MKRSSFRHFVIHLAFFLSGAIGLAYEIVWSRQLSLLLGVSIYAVSAVLVAFMGGLGIGAEFFGRRLNRGGNPLKLYGVLEIFLGIYVILFPLWLAFVNKVHLLLHPGHEGITFSIIVLRFLLAVAVLIIPTILMGGTLPALVRHFADFSKTPGHSTGKLYAINTLGAMTGCFLTGFFLIEKLGLGNTLRMGAVLNILIGGVALFIYRSGGDSLERMKRAKALGEKDKISEGMDLTLLTLFGVSGFCALALELLWTRMLVLLLNNTTYAFSLILAVFLLGIGAGSAVVARFTRKTKMRREVYFAFFQVGIGVFALFSLAGLLANSPFIEVFNAVIGSKSLLYSIIPGGGNVAAAICYSLFLVFPCTFLMGGSMPLIVDALSKGRENIGGDVGRIYLVNTLGCVLGSLLAGYFLISLIGIHNSVIAISWLAVLSGSYLILSRGMEYRTFLGGVAVLVIIPLTLFLFYKPDVSYQLSVQKLDVGSRVDYYREGPSATVLVSSQESDMTIGRKPVKRLWINGDPIAGSFREALMLERLQAHIPLLLHENPRNAVVICFGTGSTAGAMAAHGLESVLAVDISTEVFSAAPMFVDGNLGVSDRRNVRYVEEDGRNFLLTSPKQFDFITSEPPPPSNAGIVSLYTVEYYKLFRERLADGGIVSQWIPLHHLSLADFRMLVASFLEVFPNATMWFTKWDAILIGGKGDLSINFDVLKERMKQPEVAASLLEIGITTPHQLLSNYMMGTARLREFVKGVEPLRDDWPVVEFSAPRVGDEGVTIKGDNLAALLELRDLPEVSFSSKVDQEEFAGHFESQGVFLEGQLERNMGRLASAARLYQRALAVKRENTDARYTYLSLNLTTLYSVLSSGDSRLGLRMLSDTQTLDEHRWFTPQLHFLKGMMLAKSERFWEAEAELKSAVKLDENYFLAIVNLAGLYGTKLNRPDEAKVLYRQALNLSPTDTERKAILDSIALLEGGRG